MSYGDERPIAATKPVRRTRMQNANRFKLGLFGMNCSGSVATTAPERWNAGWPENRAAARMAEAAGIEFLLPIARWLGYGGLTDRQGTSFETLSWASAVLAATTDIVAFATVHVPLVNPVFAAKSCVTADHVGRGRFGLNVVSGWNVDEFAMFGAQLLEHDDRYGYSEEWVSIVKQIWSQTKPFDYSGKHFNLRNVGGKPKPWAGTRPLLMSAGSSPAGRSFASRHADCLFMVISDEEMVADEIAALRATKQGLGIFASGHLMCRPTAKETKEYYHYLVHERGDWEGAETVIRKRLAGDGRSLPQDRLRAMMERFISGGGTFPVIGSYDEVAATMKRLSDAGLDGMALASVNYVQEMPVIRDELLPRLARLGLRDSLH
jgi:alkanesulfonate monooxygenase SsuD/methylene tetrahydromethanopterin reductase-like flavin-dependent oxidoreductase (luciferase family)